jgi:hypothetical protein
MDIMGTQLEFFQNSTNVPASLPISFLVPGSPWESNAIAAFSLANAADSGQARHAPSTGTVRHCIPAFSIPFFRFPARKRNTEGA